MDDLAVIIGNPGSLFTRQLASCWKSRGFDVVIVTRFWGGEKTLPDGTRILSSADHETDFRQKQLVFLRWLITWVEKVDFWLEGNRFYKVMGAHVLDYRPSFVEPIVSSISIAKLVRSLRPRFVFGQEVFSYGLATALCSGTPRLLMPWGGDIYMFGETSAIAFAMVKYALRQVDLICPSSVVAAVHIGRRYRISETKITALSWGVDRSKFVRADEKNRVIVCNKYGLDPKATIIMNVRRFVPAWGGTIALEAFIQLAKECPQLYFIMLGGVGTEHHVADARHKLNQEELSDRFVLFDGDIPPSQCAELMAVSDVFTSLMTKRDMRSLSILQAAAAGSVPILSDQEEYRAMEQMGFKAIFVNPNDINSVVNALRTCINDRKMRSEIAIQNLKYLAEFEDGDRQMSKLLELIEVVCQRYSNI